MTSSNLFSLKDKTVVITGSGRGIGFSLAKGFTQKRASIIGLDQSFISLMQKKQ